MSPELEFGKDGGSVKYTVDGFEFLDQNGDVVSMNAIVFDFEVADWIINAGWNEVELQHNLETLHPTVEVKDGVDRVFVRYETTTTNTVTLFVPVEPDLRFVGSVKIKN